MTDHVLSACHESANFINRTPRSDIECGVHLLLPEGDTLIEEYQRNESIVIGGVDNVLSRYMSLLNQTESDYIVRITGDCPLLPPFVISKHIRCAISNYHDYLSNVDPRYRTHVDGHDVEVISKKALLWLNDQKLSDSDKEHVTSYFRKNPPRWARIGHVIGHLDLSVLKLSVDTKEDLERVRRMHKSVNDKVYNAKRNGDSIYRL